MTTGGENGAPVGDAATGETALVVEDLSFAYGDVIALEGVSFAADRGSVLTVIGPNGSGKSTLLRLLAGLARPDAGTVTVTAGAERPVGYHPQRPAFRPTETVAEALRFYADLAGDGVPIEDRLDRVGLGDVADRPVTALSGGMTRLLALAQATIGDPPVLLLDEPTSDLDPDVSAAIYDVVDDLAASGRTVVAATHDLLAVEAVADDVLLLDGGRVVAHGPPASLLDRAGADSLAEAFTVLTRGGPRRTAVRIGGSGGPP